MTYDFNGYERSTFSRGSPDDIARDNAGGKVVDEGCDLSPVPRRKDTSTKIFTSTGGIDLVGLLRNV